MEDKQFKLGELCLEITDICPLNCLHCSGNCSPNSSNVIRLDRIKQILLEFKSLGGKILEISGGEPLSHPSLIEIVESARANQLETILYTSGNVSKSNLLTPIDSKFANDLKKAGLNKVVFSLQGAFSNTHETLTQVKGSHGNVLKSIQKMKTAGFWVGVHFVPTKVNYREISLLHELCERLLIDQLGVLRFVSQGRGFENEESLQLSANDFQIFRNLLQKESTKRSYTAFRIGRPIDFRFKLNPSCTKEKCDAGLSRCLIAADGRVVPCPAFKQSKAKWTTMGNVKEKTLIDIWTDAAKWHLIRSFDYTQICEPCKSCASLNKCRGGCKAQRLLKYGSLYCGPDPCCECSKLMLVLHPSAQANPARLLQVQL